MPGDSQFDRLHPAVVSPTPDVVVARRIARSDARQGVPGAIGGTDAGRGIRVELEAAAGRKYAPSSKTLPVRSWQKWQWQVDTRTVWRRVPDAVAA